MYTVALLGKDSFPKSLLSTPTLEEGIKRLEEEGKRITREHPTFSCTRTLPTLLSVFDGGKLVMEVRIFLSPYAVIGSEGEKPLRFFNHFHEAISFMVEWGLEDLKSSSFSFSSVKGRNGSYTIISYDSVTTIKTNKPSNMFFSHVRG